MNLELKNLSEKLLLALKKIGRFLPFIFALLVLGLYGFLVLHINQIMQSDIEEAEIEEIIRTGPGLEIDRQAVDAIERLQDQNVEVEAIFQEARDNPFAEAVADNELE